jgi:lipopolysaccharide/colanic/teichoic acid biosynthesis glycosyltransferase
MSSSSKGEARRRPGTYERRFKRPLDFLVLLALAPFLPTLAALWVLIPIAIWLDDRGPVYFLQERLGKDGQEFKVLKFRTMVVDASKVGPLWTSAIDPRVTRVGKVLRRTALDELPQLINIWRGDMSFVGPRALPPEMHESYVAAEPNFGLRLVIRPGLTGPALINLPRHCPAGDRLREDLRYIESVGAWLDIKLIVQTVWLTVTARWGTGQRRVVEPGSEEAD